MPLPATERSNAPRSAAAWSGETRTSPIRLTAALLEFVHAWSKAHPFAASCTCRWMAALFSLMHEMVAVCAAAAVFLIATAGVAHQRAAGRAKNARVLRARHENSSSVCCPRLPPARRWRIAPRSPWWLPSPGREEPPPIPLSQPSWPGATYRPPAPPVASARERLASFCRKTIESK